MALPCIARLTSKHVLSLFIMHDSPWLQLLGLQPVGDGNGFRLWRPGLNWLLLLLLLLLSFLLRPHLRLLLCHGLFAESLYIFLDRYAVLFRLGCELLLDLSNLLGRRLLAVRSLYVDGQSLWRRWSFLRWPALGWRSFGAHCVYLRSSCVRCGWLKGKV
jgi:hypothetical protein